MTEQLYNYAGRLGLYWSSTPVDNVRCAYELQFYDATVINASYDEELRNNGATIRCLAQ